ncbi:MAG: arginine--tRNA ligase, partial [Methanomassiliicoccales archaeon]|nr:arginine--tRNA ligase [Methanomassiliicoccales archaeon]
MDPYQPFEIEVRRLLSDALGEVGATGHLEMERPDPNIGADFAFPCFPLAKQLRKAPAVIAEELASKFKPSPMVERVFAEKGYLNVRIDQKELVESTLKAILEQKQDYGKGERKGVKVLLEHTSVNPTGPIHVGRARNPLIGDTLGRCMKACGYDVSTEYLVNDVGKQVVLLTWGLENLPPSEVPPPERQKDDHQLVGYYQKANQRLESDPKVQEEIAEMLRRFEAGDEEVIARVRRTTDRMLSGIKESLSRINIFLDTYVWESQFILNGEAREVVERLKRTPYCHEEDGAFYLDLSEFGIHGRETKFFFTRSDGTTLYTTRDMAYHLDKFKRAD